MTLQFKTENGFIMLDSSRIGRFEYRRNMGKEKAILVKADCGDLEISIDDLSEMADQGFELAKEAMAAFVADRMVNGEPRDSNEVAMERMRELMAQQRQLWVTPGTAQQEDQHAIVTTIGTSANTKETWYEWSPGGLGGIMRSLLGG